MANEYSDTLADDLAKAVFENLTSDVSTALPTVDFDDPAYNLDSDTSDNPFYQALSKLSLPDLTTGELGGAGAFDTLMRSYSAHLKREYDQGRITGAEYTAAYSSILQNAMGQAIQFLLAKDQAYAQGLLLQQQGRTAEIATIAARVQLATTKAQYGIAQVQLDQGKAQYALTKMQLATEDARYDALKTEDQINEYRLSAIMPLEVTSITKDLDLKTAQLVRAGVDTELAQYNLDNLAPAQLAGIVAETAQRTAQTLLIETQNDTAQYTLTTMMPVQLTHLNKQTEVLTQQIAKSTKEVETMSYQLASLMPVQRDQLLAQVTQIGKQTDKIIADTAGVTYSNQFLLPANRLNVEADTAIKVYTHEEILPANALNTQADTLIKNYTKDNLLPSQKKLTDEQMESKRSDTMDVRTDGATVAGSVAKQKALYSQQITSYQRDSEVKAAKMWMDNWITHQTIFESDDTPTALQTTTLNQVMSSIKSNNGL